MPTRSMPHNPSLEHVKKQAKALQRQAGAGDAKAIALIREFDPGVATEAEHVNLALTAAQLVMARSYGFPSWAKLQSHIRIIEKYSRRPEPAQELPVEDADGNYLLQLACLNYTSENPAGSARELLAARPELAYATVHTMAATGSVAECRALLAADPRQASQIGGPFNWEPLLYLTYSRLDGSAFVQTARALLEAGADPDSGFLWNGMTSPFTALTGAFGGGEQDQPPHPDSLALARLLLDAGADPNDNQALYNRMFAPENDHLELLFDYGLGSDHPSVWRERLGDNYPSPVQMVQEQLRWAADHNMTDRVRLLLDHDVDPDGLGYHPIYGDRTAYQLATQAGNREIAAILARSGARTGGIDSVQEFLGAALAGDRAEVERLTAAHPALLAEAMERKPDAATRAVETGRLPAVQLMIELGFDINAGDRTALHQAALDGKLAIARLLVERGADRQRRDPAYHSTPLGWAEHAGHQEVIDYLRPLTVT